MRVVRMVNIRAIGVVYSSIALTIRRVSTARVKNRIYIRGVAPPDGPIITPLCASPDD